MARYSPDAGLTRRMLSTMVLVVLVYAVAVLPAFLAGPLWGAAAVAAVVVLAVVACRCTDRLALWAIGAREAGPADEPELHAVLDRLCMSSGLPKPRLAISAVDVPNAFAAGSGPGSAVVCVTEGLRRRLQPAEVAAVLAHETAHVVNRDVLVSAVATFPALCAGLFLDLWTRLLTGWGGHGLAGVPAMIVGVVLLPLAAAAALLYAVGTLIGLALSRHRELCADSTGTLLTGRPTDLSTALDKITDGMQDASRDDRRALRPVSALCVVPAVAAAGGAGVAELFSTHPTLERRIELLTLVAQRLASEAPGRSEP